ncbi:MAG: T9SS type A sorting domain-containing protein [Flavobacteriales bacterium]|nr:T9SS type A sorting domain-containing protein [Flavobacteriales bacterium]
MKKSFLFLLMISVHFSYAQNYDTYISQRKSNLKFIDNSIHNKKTTSDYKLLNSKKFFGKQFKEEKKTKRFSLLNQTYNNINIFTATLKINYDQEGSIILYNDNSINIDLVSDGEFPKQELVPSYSNISKKYILESSKNYFPISESEIIPTLKLYYKIGQETFIVVFNSDYKIIYRKSLSLDKTTIPTKSANASVFMPDPITTAQVVYGGNIAHNEGTSNSEIEAQQVDILIECKHENGIYYLENDHVKIFDFSAPRWDVVTSTDGNFNFNRSQVGFQQVNAFYHISSIKEQINLYGFTDAVDYQIKVDADGENGDDNSHFHPSTPESRSTLEFGAYINGKTEHIPDAEDAEVVVHEYTHAIINSYSNRRNTNERRCLEEAMADYVAVSYATGISAYNWEKIFKWDGNESWNGRKATSDKCYSNLHFSNNPYDHSDIWIAPLMDLFFSIGKETTDKLVLNTITALDGNTTMEQAALIMLKMDSTNNNHKNSTEIFETFKKYCILNDGHLSNDNIELSSFKIINSKSFANGGELIIDFGKSFTGDIKIYSTVGYIIFQTKVLDSRTLELNSQYFDSGIYLINIQNENTDITSKIIKH